MRNKLDGRCHNCQGCKRCNRCPGCGKRGKIVRWVPQVGNRCLDCVSPREAPHSKPAKVCPWCCEDYDTERCPCRGDGPATVLKGRPPRVMKSVL